MDLVRHLTLLTLRHNFYPRERHIEGKKNDIADSLPFSDGPLLQPGPRCWPSPMSCAPSALGDLNANIQVSARGFTGFVGPIRVKNKKMFFKKIFGYHVNGALKRLHKSVKNFVEHKASYQLCVSGYDPGSGCPLSISHSLYKNYPRISQYFKKWARLSL